MKADTFLAVTDAGRKPMPSKLDGYADDLRRMREAGCTLSQVKYFLAANGVCAAIGTIHAYLRKAA